MSADSSPGSGAPRRNRGLVALAVRDLALLAEVDVAFGAGLNVLTGETGAGKSLLLDALALSLGARAHPGAVRTGAEAATVDALFAVPAGGAAAAAARAAGAPGVEDGSLLLQREISREGRSVCRINGRLCTAAQLRAVGRTLVDVHGQGEQQLLLAPASQAELLDAFAGPRAIEPIRRIAGLRERLAALEAERSALVGDPRERERRRDLLAYARDEIDAAALSAEEEEALAERRAILQNAERLLAAAASAYQDLHGPVSDGLGRAVRELEGMAGADARLTELRSPLTEALILVEEAARAIRRYRDELAVQPGELERCEQRLDLLQNLKRKYGDSVGEVLAYRNQAAAELEQWEETSAALERIEGAHVQAGADLIAVCSELTAVRTEAAKRLEVAVAPELAALGLDAAHVHVRIEPGPLGPRGADRIEFAWTVNPGEPERALHRSASGGELSRAMLALKVVLTAADPVPVLVFDEVDSGVGGTAAQAVADRLAALGTGHQVFCVTHLATIAALADRHLAVRKEVRSGRTHVAVTALDRAGRLQELARMLSGGGEAARAHAASLLGPGKS